MKKVLAVVLALAMIFSLAACGSEKESGKSEGTSDLKVGFIYLHDENSTYDKNFRDAAIAACEAKGVEYHEKVGVAESAGAYEAACNLIEDEGCSIIFADSFGHESYLAQAAAEFPDVMFGHATGTTAHTAGLANMHNAFAEIYNGRFLTGIAAGMKLNEMIEKGEITEDEAVLGYVGAYTYAEVISGYTSFYLGAKYVCPSVTMKVKFTGSWYDQTKEQEAAEALLEAGAKIISQHADSMGAPTACDNKTVPNVFYNGKTDLDTYLVSSKINWQPYFEHMIDCKLNNKDLETDYCGTLESGSVFVYDVNEKLAAPGTQEKMDEVKEKILSGDLHVFDTSTFTVTVVINKEMPMDNLNANAKVDEDGHLVSYMADVDTDAAYTGDTEVVSQGYFHESEFRSAPYFDIQIDGIELLDTALIL